MGFDDSELVAIRTALDDFCSRRSQSAGPLRYGYEIDAHRVFLNVMRSCPDGPSTWDCEQFAKFRFYRSRREWLLYWVGSDGKWHLYQPASPARKIATLVRHVDRDIHGCFMG